MSDVIARLDAIVRAKPERMGAKQTGVAGVTDDSFDAFARILLWSSPGMGSWQTNGLIVPV